MIEIAHAETKSEIEEIRLLFFEYATSLGFSLCFQGFDRELEELPSKYAPPHGALLVAKEGGRAFGCVAMRPIGPDACEMKRLYVKPLYRGQGFGRKLASAIIAEAVQKGYRSMFLDTLETMKEAKALYESMGFREIQGYYHNPIPGALFFELRLVDMPQRNNDTR